MSSRRILMKYRRFGKLDWEVSILGFGAMRLPIIGDDRGNIDEDEAIRMMRYAIDHGVNYLDTAYPYHLGNSELVVGKALMDGYRERVKLATKMPTWKVESHKDMTETLNEQLSKLKTDYVDFYLLHGLNKERWEKLQNLNVFDWTEKAIEENKIRYLGFSFHDEYDVFKRIIDEYDDWTFCQILYNYMSTEHQAGTKGLKYAASKGLAIIVMEPISGGLLAVTPPSDVQTLWDDTEQKRSPVEWAFRWVWNHPEVTLALSGMSMMKHVIENVEIANNMEGEILNIKELELISKVQEKYSELGLVGCTDCRYCMPCPEEVLIADILSLYNEHYSSRGNKESQQKVIDKYKELISPQEGARKCIKCGDCEEKCPQQLPIRNLLNRAAWVFEPEE
jgi:predicted aldo/keto reductase-like oxidoreductase